MILICGAKSHVTNYFDLAKSHLAHNSFWTRSDLAHDIFWARNHLASIYLICLILKTNFVDAL